MEEIPAKVKVYLAKEYLFADLCLTNRLSLNSTLWDKGHLGFAGCVVDLLRISNRGYQERYR